MKRRVILCIVLCLNFFITACGIGGMWMNGNPFPTPVKPYLQKWEKSGSNSEVRRQDSASCGGGASDHSPSFSSAYIKMSQQPDEKENQTYSRLFHDWERCMLKKGYRYTGECYDNEISRAKPACGAP